MSEGFGGLGFRGLGFKGLGFKGLGLRVRARKSKPYPKSPHNHVLVQGLYYNSDYTNTQVPIYGAP